MSEPGLLPGSFAVSITPEQILDLLDVSVKGLKDMTWEIDDAIRLGRHGITVILKQVP